VVITELYEIINSMINRRIKKKNGRNDREVKNLTTAAHYGTAETYCTPAYCFLTVVLIPHSIRIKQN